MYGYNKKSEILMCCLKSEGDEVKQVIIFRYRGYTLAARGKCLLEVKKRIAIAKVAFKRMKTIMKNKYIFVST